MLPAGLHSITPSLERAPKIGARKLSSPYIFVAGVQLTPLPYHFSSSTSEKTQVIPSLSPVVSGAEKSDSARICAHDLRNSGPPKSFINYYGPECLGLPIRRLLFDLLMYSFIYSYIQFQFSMSRSITLYQDKFKKISLLTNRRFYK